MSTITYSYIPDTTVYHVDEFKGVNEATIVAVSGVVDATTSLTSLTRSGAVASAVTEFPHGYATGRAVTISGANESDYNGSFTITVTGPSWFTYVVPNAPPTPATGVIISLSPVVDYKALFVKADKTVYNVPEADLFTTVDLALAEYKLRYLTP